MAKDVAQLIKEATAAVKAVPDDLRAVAFQKAFDALAGVQSGGGSPTTPPAGQGHRSSGRSGKRHTPQTSGNSNRPQLDQLDRTSHPKITQDETALANSLRVLQAAHDELGIDGLSASDIAHVLTDKFRCRITRQAVSLALNGAGRFVNRHKEGNSVIFKIMSGGKQHLAELGSGIASEQVKSPKKSRSAKNKRATKKPTSSASSRDGKPTRNRRTRKRAKSKGANKSKFRPGPKAALQGLIDDGYFATPRGISEIVDHLRHSTGHTYRPGDMSPTLVRLLRDNALTRAQNSDNKYEYKNARRHHS